MKNYCPVSNLPFLSKILEKAIASRLEQHLSVNNLHDNLQSAYRACHSTETALLKVQNDIVTALDNKCMAALVLLDLSAAFDVIDHQILYKWLEHSYGITEDALSWIQSYLTNRTQCVTISNATSSEKTLGFGVPQGSVLGPRKYCMYSKPIGEICQRHSLSYHCYADDTQLYMVIKPNDTWDTIAMQLEACLSDISAWMNANMLKLNQDKTELIIFRPKQKTRSTSDFHLKIGPNTVKASNCVKNLGVWFDNTLCMETQVNAITKSCFFQIRNIGCIRHFITQNACKTLVQSLVTSRLDYGNTLLYGITSNLTHRLQRVQNTAARLVTGTGKHCHITPILKSLHWLPVELRPQYKILTLTYKALNGTCPVYLRDLVTIYQPNRPLRSGTECLITVPRTRTVTYGNRCFSKAAAFLWNSLPANIRQSKTLISFKKNVKTHLFKQAYC